MHTITAYNVVQLSEDVFDYFMDETTAQSLPVRRFKWLNSENNVEVHVITYGSTITLIKTPNKHGYLADIVLGFDKMAGYLNENNPYIGATIGRVANRIGNARIDIDGNTFDVTANLRQHQLHGGRKGFDKVLWEAYKCENKVIMSYLSKDGEEGFPGSVLVNVTYELTSDNKFLIEFTATTTKPTFVNLTNHSYFNLAGHETGAQELYKHKITINADRITDVDADYIPNGKFIEVADTLYNFQVPKILGDLIPSAPGSGGYDNNYCINKGSEQENAFIARVTHPPSGRVLEVYSNQPGVQFYTSNGFPVETNENKLNGKCGSFYYKHGALCLETQNYPDAINHINFPKATLYPGETYHHTITYKFCTEN